MKIFECILAFIFVFYLSSCDSGGSGDSSTNLPSINVGGSSFNVSTQESIVESSGVISGSASIIHPTPGVSSKSGLHFSLVGVLSEIGSTITLHAFSDTALNGGLDLIFSNSAGGVDGSVTVNGIAVPVPNLTALNPLTFTVEIDVHNDETPAHVLVWPANTDFAEESAIFNSEEDGELGGNGTGTYWGLTLKNATLSKALAEDPKFEEE